ncbi:MAG: NADH-quinone oxidoreductase subunit M [Candidatus Dormibacteraeota bacterium]|nr:NADH-quinone oxidoreductase subunit M [Candidatus Dormibacteraeota bacterium]
MNRVPWLTLMIVLPIGGAMLLQLVPARMTSVIRGVTVVFATAVTCIAGGLLFNLPHMAASGTQPLSLAFQEQRDWIPAISASYHLGLDGLSGWLVMLNSGLFLVAALAVSRSDAERLRRYCALMLVSEGAIAGTLLAADLLLFYLFWEGMLIPLYFILSGFGGPRRGQATLKFIVYTIAGSLLMLVAILWLYFASGAHSFDLESLIINPPPAQSVMVIPGINVSTFTPQDLVFIGFAIAFAIKLPLVPFHTWLPELYVQSPATTLVFFAGIVGKMGAYGFIRYGLTLFPSSINTFKWLFAALAVTGIIYGALMALSERDIKRILAYASLSHLGFIALGIFTLTTNGISGAIIQMVNHGIIIAALFLIAGYIERRTGTRDLSEMAGLEKRMPWLYVLFLVATLASLGMPGTNSFVGEFAVMLGAFQLGWPLAVVALGGTVIACWYMLRLHQGLMHDPLKPATEHVHDIRLSEGLVLAPLVALIILLGVFPKPVGDIASPAASQYVSLASQPVAPPSFGT